LPSSGISLGQIACLLKRPNDGAPSSLTDMQSLLATDVCSLSAQFDATLSYRPQC
jgi:hypothetical protein